jgi:hypothetical protein
MSPTGGLASKSLFFHVEEAFNCDLMSTSRHGAFDLHFTFHSVRGLLLPAIRVLQNMATTKGNACPLNDGHAFRRARVAARQGAKMI